MMKKNKNRMSHSERGQGSNSIFAIKIRRRTTVLFSLAAIIPVIICGYIILRFIHPEVTRTEELISVIFIVLSLLFIAIALVRELAINVSSVGRLPEDSRLSKIANRLACEATILEQEVGIQERVKESLEKKVEERTAELAQAKDFQENIISSMADSLIMFDADEKIKEVNRETEKLLGYSQAQLMKMKMGDILTGMTAEEYSDFITSPNKAEDSTYEIKYRTRSGDEIPVSVKRSALHNDEGSLIGILIIARDIRKYLLAEARMREANKMTALGQFAAGTAHEINNPLSVISGNAQYLLGRLQEIKAGKEKTDSLVIGEVIDGLNMVYQYSLRCSSIVQRLLAFAKGAGEIPEKRKIAINSVIEETVAVLQPQFKFVNVKIVAELIGEQFMVHGNFSQLQQVFMNILLNAREAMDEGGTISLTATTERDSDNKSYICFNIIDVGSGITPEALPKVFEPFFTTKKPMGTGLGLSVAYSIVREHEGDIHLASPTGKGTTVTVRLPLC